MSQSPELTEFYQAVHAWVEAGCPSGGPLSRKHGLCFSALGYTPGNVKLHRELKEQFREAGLHETNPFNRVPGFSLNEDQLTYGEEIDAGTIWSNPLRLAWVKAHINP